MVLYGQYYISIADIYITIYWSLVMAKLVKCQLCEKEISSSAKMCPHCGHKQKVKTNILFAVIVIFLFTFIFYKCTQTVDSNTIENTIPSTNITSTQYNQDTNEESRNSNALGSEDFCRNQIYDGCITKCRERFDHDIDVNSVCTECSSIPGAISAETLNEIAICIGYRDGGWFDNSTRISKRNLDELETLKTFNVLKPESDDDNQTIVDKKNRLLTIYANYEKKYNETISYWAKQNGPITLKCRTAYINQKKAEESLTKLDEQQQHGILTIDEYNMRSAPIRGCNRKPDFFPAG